MLQAIKVMYVCTKNIFRSAIIDISIGVRQSAPSNCLLFVIYIDHIIRVLKRAVPTDGFLDNLHLLLMDDSVTLDSNREMCKKKYILCVSFVKKVDWKLRKRKLFVINDQECHRRCLSSMELRVKYDSEYLYLGAWFTDSRKSGVVVARHETASEAVVNKFSIFCASNAHMPFIYKNLMLQ